MKVHLPTTYSSRTIVQGRPKNGFVSQETWRKFFTGQILTRVSQRYACVRRLLGGNALTVFDLTAAELRSETTQQLQDVLRALRNQVFPQRTLQKQKRYMRWALRKPRSMSIRIYVNRVLELNDQLENFPGTGNDVNETKLPEDEVLDLLEFGIPNSWQKAMVLQDFDPQVHTVNDFV